jgi:hypothetical protein
MLHATCRTKTALPYLEENNQVVTGDSSQIARSVIDIDQGDYDGHSLLNKKHPFHIELSDGNLVGVLALVEVPLNQMDTSGEPFTANIKNIIY